MSDEVLIGTDGWLFLKGGSNSLISYYDGSNRFDAPLVRAWCDLLRRRYDALRSDGISYVHLFVPNKLSVYPEQAGIGLAHFNDHPIAAFMKGMDGAAGPQDYHNCVVNPIAIYQEKKKDYLLYWKTDTHWTYWGCYWAYALICERLGIAPNRDLMKRDFGEVELALDLGGKLTPPVTEKAQFYHTIKDSSRVYANEIVTYKERNNLENEVGLHVGSQVIYQNRKALSDKKVVLFGDSFSEYRPHLLTGLLAETFSEVHYVWSTSIDFAYVRRYRPDVVVTEIVERFMPLVPDDNFSLEECVREKLRLTKRTFLRRQLDRLRRLKMGYRSGR